MSEQYRRAHRAYIIRLRWVTSGDVSPPLGER